MPSEVEFELLQKFLEKYSKYECKGQKFFKPANTPKERTRRKQALVREKTVKTPSTTFIEAELYYNMSTEERLFVLRELVAGREGVKEATRIIGKCKNVRQTQQDISLMLGKTWYECMAQYPQILTDKTILAVAESRQDRRKTGRRKSNLLTEEQKSAYWEKLPKAVTDLLDLCGNVDQRERRDGATDKESWNKFASPKSSLVQRYQLIRGDLRRSDNAIPMIPYNVVAFSLPYGLNMWSEAEHSDTKPPTKTDIRNMLGVIRARNTAEDYTVFIMCKFQQVNMVAEQCAELFNCGCEYVSVTKAGKPIMSGRYQLQCDWEIGVVAYHSQTAETRSEAHFRGDAKMRASSIIIKHLNNSSRWKKADSSTANRTELDGGLSDWFFRVFTKPGDTALLPMMGSGSEVIMALNCGLDCVGMDIRQSQVEETRRRVLTVVNQMHELGEHFDPLSLYNPAIRAAMPVAPQDKVGDVNAVTVSQASNQAEKGQPHAGESDTKMLQLTQASSVMRQFTDAVNVLKAMDKLGPDKWTADDLGRAQAAAIAYSQNASAKEPNDSEEKSLDEVYARVQKAVEVKQQQAHDLDWLNSPDAEPFGDSEDADKTMLKRISTLWTEFARQPAKEQHVAIKASWQTFTALITAYYKPESDFPSFIDLETLDSAWTECMTAMDAPEDTPTVLGLVDDLKAAARLASDSADAGSEVPSAGDASGGSVDSPAEEAGDAASESKDDEDVDVG